MFRDKIWRAAKIKSDYGHVMNATKEAKRKKEQEVLKLPQNQRSAVENVVNRERECLSQNILIRFVICRWIVVNYWRNSYFKWIGRQAECEGKIRGQFSSSIASIQSEFVGETDLACTVEALSRYFRTHWLGQSSWCGAEQRMVCHWWCRSNHQGFLSFVHSFKYNMVFRFGIWLPENCVFLWLGTLVLFVHLKFRLGILICLVEVKTSKWNVGTWNRTKWSVIIMVIWVQFRIWRCIRCLIFWLLQVATQRLVFGTCVPRLKCFVWEVTRIQLLQLFARKMIHKSSQEVMIQLFVFGI